MPFRQADWAAAKQAVLQPLLTGRYPAARIAASEARVDPATQSADLTLTLDSGPAFFYGQPVISGSQRYPESIALHLNPTQPGKPVRQQDLFDYQTALEASGYYAQAVVSIESDPALAAAVPIRVELVERPEKLFSVGAGYSTDTGVRAGGVAASRHSGSGLAPETGLCWKPRRAGLAELSGRAMPGAITAWACNSSRGHRVGNAFHRWARSAAAPRQIERRCRCSTD
jgi:translocation and assembly module TamA